MAITYTVSVPKHILEGGNDDCYEYRVTAKDQTRALRRARELAIERGDFAETTIDSDWRWQRAKVRMG